MLCLGEKATTVEINCVGLHNKVEDIMVTGVVILRFTPWGDQPLEHNYLLGTIFRQDM